MNELDDTILEFIDGVGAPDDRPVVWSPKQIYNNINVIRKSTDKATNTVSRRMQKLEERGLLERHDEFNGSYYSITDLGRRYLSGEAGREELV